MRNGGQLLADGLAALGATKCFGAPGESHLAGPVSQVRSRGADPAPEAEQMQDAGLTARDRK
ncbi:MAG: hypothetical protein CVT80_10795 [Alphaproteobacteria bacterium HGW-Alphaproteobacteria-2]|nr:MAG: hypothetical protein CVT80_10795 [Alphaproteobacteria bacterium HGW-Alphaproteobacteria-2]